MKTLIGITLALLIIAACNSSTNTAYLISDKQGSVPIYVDTDTDSLIFWAVNDLAGDIEKITGNRPDIFRVKTAQSTKGIYIGECKDPLIRSLNLKQTENLHGAWEKFHINVHQENLVISGSDIRGTIFGVFDMAEYLGISPWKWWGDVTPAPQKSLILNIAQDGITEEPSVQYRGIFLNDEDWGLHPWAANTFEPETGDIGPKTYEKIFQLLLRLKANSIWPAMHPCTKGFYQVPGNNEMAKKYHIVVGTSHCEPMLRNNVDEWNSEEYGDFNFFTNQNSVCNYWQTRIEEVSDAENIITLGMRGVHDGRMQGGKNNREKKEMLENIIHIQRSLLTETKGKPLDSIAQNIILYKEVLDYYNMGLDVPEDVTLMWCDDNHGYIRRLSNEEEQKRSGGSGVYYHLSYWGSPHDYLWLSTTQPGLIWYEMRKAYDNKARKIWIVNVGDIKPAEYNTEFFLDMAWDVNSIDHNTIGKHLKNWAAREFGENISEEVAEIMNEYYGLAFIRRPEHMGWNRVEPHTPPMVSGFNSNVNGNEPERRISMYQELVNRTEQLKKKVPVYRTDAWFQLVEYPVKGAALMNYKFLYAQMAKETSDSLKQMQYHKLSEAAYDQIKQITSCYNEEMSSAKWKFMISMAPRNLNVYKMPDWNSEPTDTVSITSTNKSGQRIFIQANEYDTKKESDSFTWQSISGLGYSNRAVTLSPFQMHSFTGDAQPWIEYSFDAEEKGAFELQVRCLPTHSNNFDHEISIRIDEGELQTYSINTKGRSEEWKNNIIRNSQIVRHRSGIDEAGKHTIRLYVNQTGIVIDQLAIDFDMEEPFYEIPVDRI